MKCSKCGNTKQYYVKSWAKGYVIWHTRIDGEEAENGAMYDGLEYHDYKAKYCSECHKKLTKKELETIVEDEEEKK